MNSHGLKTPIQFLKGVGEKRAEGLRQVGIETVGDLLEYFPRRYLDRSTILSIGQVEKDMDVTIVGEVIGVERVHRGKPRLIVRVYDRTGILEAVWFNQIDIFERLFKPGQTVAFSGKIGYYRQWQMVHPDFDIISEDRNALHTGQIIPVYSSTEGLKRLGLSSYGFRRIVHNALGRYASEVKETLPEYLLHKYHLMPRAKAFQQVHFPESQERLNQAYRRFKYEELFFLELLMALRKHYYHSPVMGIPVSVEKHVVEELLSRLPFQLTRAQRQVLSEILEDFQRSHPMNRLLQGDVGSGKTIVAWLAMMVVVQSGFQAAFMAPTEILAQQHFRTFSNLCRGLPVRLALLIGSLPERAKMEVRQKLASGDIDLVIGTHTLIQEQVSFARLALAVIDEQHRFGVAQRSSLIQKGKLPHVLVMTATPIPRTLALTLYGDLDVSVIDELPPGRKPVKTFWRTQERLPRILNFIRQQVQQGRQAYVVYPIIEESEKLELKAATEAFERFQKKVFQEFELGLLHGRMKMEEKDEVMRRFREGKIHILVATTVIEVGVDVPNATIMLIEHAERFGLSQLHQLRGRVGRGAEQAYCILVTPGDINDLARQRMEVMVATTDGFRIAEEDLRLRGSGEFFGTRQHGMPDLRFADLIRDSRMIQAARRDAFALVEQDPHLRQPAHLATRIHFKEYFAEKFQMSLIS